MKAAFIRQYGGNDSVQIGAQPEPVLRPHDLLVAVKAASVNPVDFKIRAGQLKRIQRFRFPLILGSDLAGVVVKTGAAVTRFQAGDEIYARLEKDRIGTFAELAAVAESVAAPKPRNLSFVEAASLPLVGLTSWQALFELGGLQRGQRVLIHAGAGGIGTAAIQLAKHGGAHVATTVSARNAALVKRLGADEVIDYRAERFEERLRDYDLVYDTLAGETQLRSFAVLKPGGVLVTIAGLPTAAFARAEGLNPLLVATLGWLNRKATRLAKQHGVRFEYLFMRPDGAQLAELTKLAESGALVPVIDRVFPLDQTKEALAYNEAGHTTGKVVIEVSN